MKRNEIERKLSEKLEANYMEVVRDKWLEENGSGMVHDDELSHALWSIADTQDAEQDYELAEAFRPPEREVRMC